MLYMTLLNSFLEGYISLNDFGLRSANINAPVILAVFIGVRRRGMGHVPPPTSKNGKIFIGQLSCYTILAYSGKYRVKLGYLLMFYSGKNALPLYS